MGTSTACWLSATEVTDTTTVHTQMVSRSCQRHTSWTLSVSVSYCKIFWISADIYEWPWRHKLWLDSKCGEQHANCAGQQFCQWLVNVNTWVQVTMRAGYTIQYFLYDASYVMCMYVCTYECIHVYMYSTVHVLLHFSKTFQQFSEKCFFQLEMSSSVWQTKGSGIVSSFFQKPQTAWGDFQKLVDYQLLCTVLPDLICNK